MSMGSTQLSSVTCESKQRFWFAGLVKYVSYYTVWGGLLLRSFHLNFSLEQLVSGVFES